MKYLLVLMFIFSFGMAEAKVIKEGEVEYSCNPIYKKSCEDKLKEANAEIKRLRKLTKVVEVIKEKEVIKEVPAEINRNRISIALGNGTKEGLDTSKYPTVVEVESRVGVIAGLQYQRLITDILSVGIEAQTNKSILLNIGLDF